MSVSSPDFQSFKKPQTSEVSLKSPQNINSVCSSTSKDSPQRETIPCICGFSRCGLNTRLHTLVSKPCSEATNTGYGLSLGAVFGYLCKLKIYFEKNLRETSDSYGLNKFMNSDFTSETSKSHRPYLWSRSKC